MSESCCPSDEAIRKLSHKHRNVLWAVLLINLGMFFVEAIAGFLSGSTSVLADSLDMLGDASIYGGSIYILNRSARAKNSMALAKGILMGVLGLGVIIDAIRRFFEVELPHSDVMTVVGAMALAANLTCALLLLKHRGDDMNMRSTWLCSRNDVLASTGVIVAGLAVSYWNSRWPDLVIGGAIALLVLHSSWSILRDAAREMRQKP